MLGHRFGRGDCIAVGEEVVRSLDRYGWHPCPSWTGASWARSRP
jgi:signal-transduction protein with cAMP-binding, CBS, and nucleotidyltransferase domain